MRKYDNYDLMALGAVVVLIALPFWQPYELGAPIAWIAAYAAFVLGLFVSRRRS